MYAVRTVYSPMPVIYGMERSEGILPHSGACIFSHGAFIPLREMYFPRDLGIKKEHPKALRFKIIVLKAVFCPDTGKLLTEWLFKKKKENYV